MNIQSRDAENIDPVIEEKKKGSPIAYGGISSGGRGSFPALSLGSDGGYFDKIFEKLGIKKRSRQPSEAEK